jgi:WD40 repeat protein
MLYLDRVAAASRLWSSNQVAAAGRLLDECPEPFRQCWEWRFLNSLRRPYLDDVPHDGLVSALAYRPPDGRDFASAGPGDVVELRDTASGRALSRPANHGALVIGMAFSPDGRLLACAGIDRVVHIWEVATSRPVGSLQGHTDSIREVAFSPDGLRLVSGSADGTARLWDVGSGRELISLPGVTGGVGNVAFSPDGLRIVAADSQVKLWEVGPSGPEPSPLQGPRTGARIAP